MSRTLVLCRHQHAPVIRNRETKNWSRSGWPAPAGQARRGTRRRVPDDVRRFDAQMGESRDRLAVVVRASRTILTGIVGVGPVIAVTVLDDVADASWFASRGPLRRLQRHAQSRYPAGIARPAGFPAHQIPSAWATITQIRQRHSDSRAYYDRKLAESKATKRSFGPWGGSTSRVLICDERHLRSVLREYAGHYRPLQRAPGPPVPPATPARPHDHASVPLNLPVLRRKVLGGVINEYYRAA